MQDCKTQAVKENFDAEMDVWREERKHRMEMQIDIDLLLNGDYMPVLPPFDTTRYKEMPLIVSMYKPLNNQYVVLKQLQTDIDQDTYLLEQMIKHPICKCSSFDIKSPSVETNNLLKKNQDEWNQEQFVKYMTCSCKSSIYLHNIPLYISQYIKPLENSIFLREPQIKYRKSVEKILTLLGKQDVLKIISRSPPREFETFKITMDQNKRMEMLNYISSLVHENGYSNDIYFTACFYFDLYIHTASEATLFQYICQSCIVLAIKRLTGFDNTKHKGYYVSQIKSVVQDTRNELFYLHLLDDQLTYTTLYQVLYYFDIRNYQPQDIALAIHCVDRKLSNKETEELRLFFKTPEKVLQQMMLDIKTIGQEMKNIHKQCIIWIKSSSG